MTNREHIEWMERVNEEKSKRRVEESNKKGEFGISTIVLKTELLNGILCIKFTQVFFV